MKQIRSLKKILREACRCEYHGFTTTVQLDRSYGMTWDDMRALVG